MVTYLDTHVALWLYAGETSRISKRAAAAINQEVLLVSPMVLLELQYLREIGRITVAPRAIVTELKRQLGLTVQDVPFEAVAKQAADIEWTRDVFDRMIVAQAAMDGSPL